MLDLVIVGSSGFAREIEWLISRCNEIEKKYNFIGFIDSEKGYRIIGDDKWLLDRKSPLAVVIAIGNGEIRKKLFEIYKSNNYLEFPSVIDPSVVMSKDTKLGIGNIICASTIITIDVLIGNFNIINLDCTIGHEVHIHDFVTINPSVNISGNTEIESCVNIGTGTQVIQGKKVGIGSIIGAGAVVCSDIEGNCTAVGVPAKVIKRNE